MNYVSNIQDLIGHTPLFEITHIDIPNQCRIFAKLEYFNPGGSVKDRQGVELLKDALEKDDLKPGGTIIEPTAGNTGIGLALAAVNQGFNVMFVVPEKFSIEKQTLMKALGAKIVHTKTEDGMKGAIEKAKELETEIENSFSPAQFSNPANPNTYYKSLGPELYQDLNGNIDVFVAGAGTGGTFMGTARYLKERDSNIKTAIVEPEGSILNGGESGPHETEGIGMEFLPDYMDTDYFDGIHTIPDAEAFKQLKILSQKEGLLVASSSGSAFAAALKEAEVADKGSHIVTVFPDSSERYLSKQIYEGWD
ncbi:PLP-dependent cysteine synthase family protein [Tenuibacillus multivorans]|uniref:cysteine synthase n=1 Tax=Tenuibacillus multivorans TaxID=237069 RepID=A0A1G9WRX1_9BACI|nr:cysteine synthase family protein [Tenuibacillus multivorans]GEL77953.1 cysteine synthase [Tenuibacillus multivorans]SDM87178.1 O-acetylserine dependent cystathionine beta-synthase [Tenuibacillus multivorans]